MIKFYYSPAPNPMKVALLLAETGLEFEAVPVDTRKGEQFAPDFVKINPNGKVPVIVDGDATVFDSNAILLYLADKSGQFVPAIADSAKRGQMLSWLMFIASGVGPFSGQSVHFRHAAPEPKEYALNRFDFEAHRHFAVLEGHLANNAFMLGDDYSIVDMAFWGWARMMPFVLGIENPWEQYPNIKRLLDVVDARPASERVKEIVSAHEFKSEMDDEARRFMFPQNERLA
ncbi:glutathione S-transferase family protein [Granulosicoccus antarcticus]|uniref:Disulfide-bond oxidoreductase YfcG n=1 Tax=Granulosicoccus antarcticus IMCC3135 TaxID=1192854 RepID=A0A2Z2NIJ0_9GAMM|nr:glutathione S-transferase N-terminal domain-containing protein [Granulosicoccus antarcticus]ASJ70969.1 Disulfide-bond oxidoreductase YfcG [Granulosicoccus antarcticus IMCC3135]